MKRSEKVELLVVDESQKNFSVSPTTKKGVIYRYFE